MGGGISRPELFKKSKVLGSCHFAERNSCLDEVLDTIRKDKNKGSFCGEFDISIHETLF